MKKNDYIRETVEHIIIVEIFVSKLIALLKLQSENHDISKLSEPEIDYFQKYTPLLKNSVFGSKKYNQFLEDLKPALEHHYKVNRHHPNGFKNGIKDMNLVDLIEMICDWKASSMRHKTGDIYKSLEINQKRFNYTDELKSIFKNTLLLLEDKK